MRAFGLLLPPMQHLSISSDRRNGSDPLAVGAIKGLWSPRGREPGYPPVIAADALGPVVEGFELLDILHGETGVGCRDGRETIQHGRAIIVPVTVGNVLGHGQIRGDLQEGDHRHPPHGGQSVEAGFLLQPVRFPEDQGGRPPHHRIRRVLEVEHTVGPQDSSSRVWANA